MPGVTYDPVSYTIRVEVYDDGLGSLQTIVTGLPEDQEARFTNTYQTGSLELKKSVTGNAASSSDIFTYTVQIKQDNQPLSGTFGGYTFDDGGKTTVQVSADASVVIRNLPAGISYTVTEDINGTGYTKTFPTEENCTGTIIADDIQEAEFINNKDTFGDLQLTKKTAGNRAGKRTA